MNMNFASAISMLAAFSSMAVLAQQPNVPKASEADVQKVINSIKADNAKMAAYCESWKLDAQINAIAAKNQNDPKLESLDKQLGELNYKIGPDFEKIIYSQLDDSSSALLDELAKSCK